MDNKVMELLNTAITMEKNGYDFYKKTEENSKNSITSKLFGSLAEQELLHIEYIKKFYDTLTSGEQLPSIDMVKAKRDESKIFDVDIATLKEKVKNQEDEAKAYEFALDLEKKGYGFYEKLLTEVIDPNLKLFIEFLVKEEKLHYALIEKAYGYVTDTQNWFMYEEGGFPQG